MLTQAKHLLKTNHFKIPRYYNMLAASEIIANMNTLRSWFNEAPL